MNAVDKAVNEFMAQLRHDNPAENEFHQAVAEVVASVMPRVLDCRRYRDARILERLTTPDRIVQFKVCWEDDQRRIQIRRAWRVQFSNAIGPYKGGLRFDSELHVGVLKFLGFEQTFKNSLTGLPMGGAKGGADFSPKGRSEREVMRFCQALMTELHRYLGDQVDIPAGDVGVGQREISFLFGQYLRLTHRFNGILTGKGMDFGGSAIRSEATGYGCVYFCQNVLERDGDSIEGKRIAISGAGNVAVFAAEKAWTLGARVLTLSDTGGTLYARDGFSEEQLHAIKRVKLEERGQLAELAEQDSRLEHRARATPWDVECDVAMPCAIQNELDESAAGKLIENGVRMICEGANMPCTRQAVERLRASDVIVAPAKAANAGGVAVSGLERTQNAMHLSFSRDRVDEELRQIMADIHEKCVRAQGDEKRVDYVDGANIAGFTKVADTLLAYGIV